MQELVCSDENTFETAAETVKKAMRVNEDNEGKISVMVFGKVSVISEEDA